MGRGGCHAADGIQGLLHGGRVPKRMDMHRHVVNGTMDRVVEVHPDRSHKVQKQDSPAWTFYYVGWLTRCDVVTHTPQYIDLEHVFDKRWHTVEWTDEKTIPWERQKHAAWYVPTSVWRPGTSRTPP